MPKNVEKIRGVILDCFPNAHFKVEIDGGKIVKGYAAGRLRMHKIKMIIGDKVMMEVPEYGDIYRIVIRL